MWEIQRSTHPWLEGQKLFTADTEITIQVGSADGQREVLESLHFHGFEWTVLECSFAVAELISLFQAKVRTATGARSRL